MHAFQTVAHRDGVEEISEFQVSVTVCVSDSRHHRIGGAHRIACANKHQGVKGVRGQRVKPRDCGFCRGQSGRDSLRHTGRSARPASSPESWLVERFVNSHKVISVSCSSETGAVARTHRYGASPRTCNGLTKRSTSVALSSGPVPLDCISIACISLPAMPAISGCIALQAIGIVRFQVTGRAPMRRSSCTPFRAYPALFISHHVVEMHRLHPHTSPTRSHRRCLFQNLRNEDSSGITSPNAGHYEGVEDLNWLSYPRTSPKPMFW
jgi:hypothetical protein